MDLLKSKHIQERQLFFTLLSDSEKYEDQRQVAALSSQQQRLDKLAELRQARKKSVEGMVNVLKFRKPKKKEHSKFIFSPHR